MTVFKDWVFPH